MVLDGAWVDPQPKGSGKRVTVHRCMGTLCPVQGGSQGEGGTAMGPKGFFRNPKVVSILILLPFPNGHPKRQIDFSWLLPNQT